MPAEMLFSFVVLTFLRLNRRVTWLCFLVSVFLSGLALCFSFVPCGLTRSHTLEADTVCVWLSAAAWVTTTWGTRDPFWTIFLLPVLLSSAGLTGIVTGIALNLHLPQRKPRPEIERYGIYRHR